MLLATGQARFAAIMERSLYNAILGGVSLDGLGYFYVNPLASNGREEHLSRGGCRRRGWHRVACCPPNVMRLLASLGHYFATRDPSGLQIHQYGSARIVFDVVAGRRVAVHTESAYPWEGRVRISIDEAAGGRWVLAIRGPDEGGATTVRINGAAIEAAPDATGYLRLERPWATGDVVELDLPMAPRLVEAHPWIESTRGCLAIERGPLVYCLEQCDQPSARVADLEIDGRAPLASRWEPNLLGGVVVIQASGTVLDVSAWRDRLYRPVGSDPPPARRSLDLTAIPYYAWANRAAGAMRVWIPALTEESRP